MAYSLTKADVLLVAKELAELDDPRWASAIEAATMIVSNVDAWGGDAKAKVAAKWLAAHLAKLELVALHAKGAQNAVGPVTSIQVGPVQKSFASLATFISDKAALQASYALTPYGITFAAMQRTFSFGRFVVT